MARASTNPADNPADLGGDDTETTSAVAPTQGEPTSTKPADNPADLGGEDLVACIATGINGVVAGTIVNVSARNVAESVERGHIYEPVSASFDAREA